MEFKTSPDATSKMLTSLVCVLLGIEAVHMLYRLSLGLEDDWTVLLQLLILIAIPFLAWLFSPQAYELRGGALVIVRPFRPVVIPFAEIQGVHVVDPEDVSWAVRVMGVGGMFGYYGKFWRTELGFASYYLRNKENPIVLETTHGRIVLSPDSPELARALRTAMVG